MIKLFVIFNLKLVLLYLLLMRKLFKNVLLLKLLMMMQKLSSKLRNLVLKHLVVSIFKH